MGYVPITQEHWILLMPRVTLGAQRPDFLIPLLFNPIVLLPVHTRVFRLCATTMKTVVLVSIFPTLARALPALQHEFRGGTRVASVF